MNDARKRVLLVEDEPVTREMTAELIDLLGHDCLHVASGRAAIEAAALIEPHVVLLDIGLPDMTGLDVARQLRRQSQSHQPIIAAFTARSQPADIQRSLDAGMNLHLVKPVGSHALRRVLESSPMIARLAP